jgi:ribosomal protein S18 acetylase RimI-like enzyme
VSISVRQAVAADVPVIVDFNCRLAQESENKPLDPEVLTRGVRATFGDPHKGPYFVAEIAGQIVGQTQITYEWSDWRNGWIWWIQGVYVRSEARRRGVFRSLYQHISQAAQADPEVVALRLYVERDNHAAQQTYESLGMARSGYLVMERSFATDGIE